MTVTVTFAGDTLDEAMRKAFQESSCYGQTIMLASDVLASDVQEKTGANGHSKEDVVLTEDGKATDNKTILSQALELLAEVYAAPEESKNGNTPKEAVTELLGTYDVDNLREVPEEQASDLFSDAARLAGIYGVTV